MADITIGLLHKLMHELPLNTICMMRIPDTENPGEFITVDVGLVAYSEAGHFIFLAKDDV
jgi:hypothetical protein